MNEKTKELIEHPTIFAAIIVAAGVGAAKNLRRGDEGYKTSEEWAVGVTMMAEDLAEALANSPTFFSDTENL